MQKFISQFVQCEVPYLDRVDEIAPVYMCSRSRGFEGNGQLNMHRDIRP